MQNCENDKYNNWNEQHKLPISTKRAIWNCKWTSTVFLRGFEWSLSENENHTLICTYTGGLTRIFRKIGDPKDIFWGRHFSCSRSQGVAALVSQSGTIVRRAGLSSALVHGMDNMNSFSFAFKVLEYTLWLIHQPKNQSWLTIGN